MGEYRYHAQRQAEGFAAGIIPVPPAYPTAPGLAEGFCGDFARLCALIKTIYLDMAKDPAGYGLMLLPIAESDHNLARDSYRTMHRVVDALGALFACGEVQGNVLAVDAERFRVAIRKNPSVPKYALVLGKLCGFGFAISDLEDSGIDKKACRFTVALPADPPLIGALAVYFARWRQIDCLRSRRGAEEDAQIRLSPQEFHHHYYRFDYKITADLERISVLTWVRDEADFQGYGAQLKAFAQAFYVESLNYPAATFDGDYHAKGKRIARIASTDYEALGDPAFALSLKLKEMDRYTEVLEALSDEIARPFAQGSCTRCGFQGATEQKCKFRLRWRFRGEEREGCAYRCFVFRDFSPDSAAVYWKLLALEYGLARREAG